MEIAAILSTVGEGKIPLRKLDASRPRGSSPLSYQDVVRVPVGFDAVTLTRLLVVVDVGAR